MRGRKLPTPATAAVGGGAGPDSCSGARPQDQPHSRSDSQPESSADSSPHIGAYLAAQRRLRGISREELSALTRIPLRSIERLEDGHFDDVDDGFVRGFVRTVAEALGLDANDTQSRMCTEPMAGESDGHMVVSLTRAGIFLVLLLLGLSLFGLVGLVIKTGFTPTESELVVRRDPVRLLAQAQGNFASSGPEDQVPVIEPSPVAGPDLPSALSEVAAPLSAEVGGATSSAAEARP